MLKNTAQNLPSVIISFCQRLMSTARGETINSLFITDKNSDNNKKTCLTNKIAQFGLSIRIICGLSNKCPSSVIATNALRTADSVVS